MAKSASKPVKANNKPAKIQKGKNSITKDHTTDLIIHGKRKRHPTQRLLESLALNKQNKRVKKVVPAKKPIKRLNTMQVTARDGEKYLKDAGTPNKRGADKQTRSPGRSPARKTEDKTKKTNPTTPKNRERSRSQSTKGKKATESPTPTSKKAASGTNKRSASKSGTKGGNRSTSTAKSGSKSPAKKVLNRTRTMADTIEESKRILKGSAKPKGRTRSNSKPKSK